METRVYSNARLVHTIRALEKRATFLNERVRKTNDAGKDYSWDKRELAALLNAIEIVKGILEARTMANCAEVQNAKKL
jgi:hypothetical protein